MKKTAFLFFLLLLVLLACGNAFAAKQTLHLEWSYDTSLPNLAGYYVYQDGGLIDDVDDPSQLAVDIDVEAEAGEHFFTLSAYDNDGNESAQSEPYLVTIEESDLLPAPLIKKATVTITFDAEGNIESVVIQGARQ